MRATNTILTSADPGGDDARRAGPAGMSAALARWRQLEAVELTLAAWPLAQRSRREPEMARRRRLRERR